MGFCHIWGRFVRGVLPGFWDGLVQGKGGGGVCSGVEESGAKNSLLRINGRKSAALGLG